MNAPQTYPANEALSSFPLLTYSAELGGIPVGILRASPSEPPYLLILNTDPTADFDAEWGLYGTRVEGCDSRVDGVANTMAMQAAGCEAAVKVRELTIAGHNDWYIPARAEALLCHAVAKEELPNGWIWTSTQSSAISAWGQNFTDGRQYDTGKLYQGRVRAVRRLVLQ